MNEGGPNPEEVQAAAAQEATAQSDSIPNESVETATPAEPQADSPDQSAPDDSVPNETTQASPPDGAEPPQQPAPEQVQVSPEEQQRQQLLQELMENSDELKQLPPEEQLKLQNETAEQLHERLLELKAKLYEEMNLEFDEGMSDADKREVLDALTTSHMKMIADIQKLLVEEGVADAETSEEAAQNMADHEASTGADSQEVKDRFHKAMSRAAIIALPTLLVLEKWMHHGIKTSRSQDFFSNFIPGKGGYGAVGGADYPWGKDDEKKAVSRAKFEDILKNRPKDFAQKLEKAYKATNGLKDTWFKKPGEQQVNELLKKAIEGDTEALRQVLDDMTEVMMNEGGEEEQKKAWMNFAEFMGKGLDDEGELKLSRDIWELFNAEYHKGSGQRFEKYFKPKAST